MTFLKEQHISTLELTKFLGISPVAVFKRIKKGQIKATKIGRSYAIPRSYIDESFPEHKIPTLEQGEYLSVMEAAQLLGISRIAVFKKIKSGLLPAQKIGRHYVIAKEKIITPKEEIYTQVTIEKDYYSVPELAAILGINRITVFKQIKKGAIKAKKVGRHFVIERSQVPIKGTPDYQRTAPADQYISIIETARILGVSRIAIFKQVKKGNIKAIKMGRSYATPKTELNGDFIQLMKNKQKEKNKTG